MSLEEIEEMEIDMRIFKEDLRNEQNKESPDTKVMRRHIRYIERLLLVRDESQRSPFWKFNEFNVEGLFDCQRTGLSAVQSYDWENELM